MPRAGYRRGIRKASVRGLSRSPLRPPRSHRRRERAVDIPAQEFEPVVYGVIRKPLLLAKRFQIAALPAKEEKYILPLIPDLLRFRDPGDIAGAVMVITIDAIQGMRLR